jgi:hypothetical protein
MATLAEILSLIPTAKRNSARAWAAYSMQWLPLLASAAGVKGSVTTKDDSDFIVVRIKAYCTTNAIPPVENATPQATLDKLTIGSIAMFPDDNGQHLGQFAISSGDRRGHELEFPVWLPAQTSLNALLTNLTATDIMVRLTFWGFRIFPVPRSKAAL